MKLLIFFLLSFPLFGAKLDFWFQGPMEAALKEAKQKRRPLFVYWGALWCPPCQRLRNAIFATDTFQQEIRRFVPVYLDGDQENSEAWAKKLKFGAFPTVMILNSGGQELMRLPTTQFESEPFVKLMQTVRKQNTSVKELYEQALSGQNLSQKEWDLLSQHTWYADKNFQLVQEKPLEKFQKLYEKVPVQYEQSRLGFLLNYLSAYEKEKEAKKVVPALTGTMRQEFNKLITSRERLAKVGLWQSSLPAYIELFHPNPSAKKVVWQKTLENSMAAQKANQALPIQQIDQLQTELNIYQKNAPKQPPPQAFKRKVRKTVEQLDQVVKEKTERHAFVPYAVNILAAVKEFSQAESLALKESKNSHESASYKRLLVSLNKQQKKYQEALRWSEKAWRETAEKTLRARYGAYYLEDLFEHNPKAYLQTLDEYAKETYPALSMDFPLYNRFSSWMKKFLAQDKKRQARTQAVLQKNCSLSSTPDDCQKWAKSFGT